MQDYYQSRDGFALGLPNPKSREIVLQRKIDFLTTINSIDRAPNTAKEQILSFFSMASVDASDTVSNSDSETSRNKHGHELQNKTPLQALSHGGVVLGGIPKHLDFRSHCQWQLDHMAAAFRHWHREGYVEGMSGHISVRDPEFPNAFWTNPLGRHFGLFKVDDMIFVNLDGSVILVAIDLLLRLLPVSHSRLGS